MKSFWVKLASFYFKKNLTLKIKYGERKESHLKTGILSLRRLALKKMRQHAA